MTNVLVERQGDFVTVTMNRPERRNALSLEHMRDLLAAFEDVGASDALGVVLAGNGPVFCAGHDFADVASASHADVRRLLWVCTELMTTMQAIPQPVIARVHGLATAAGCQLVATADLAVAADTAGFAAPGGKGGWGSTPSTDGRGRRPRGGECGGGAAAGGRRAASSPPPPTSQSRPTPPASPRQAARAAGSATRRWSRSPATSAASGRRSSRCP